MARDQRFALLAATLIIAAASAHAQSTGKRFTGGSSGQAVTAATVPAPTSTSTTVAQAPAAQRQPGDAAVHVNPAASAASGTQANAAVQAAPGVRPTTRNAEDRRSTTATQDATSTSSNNTADLPAR